MSHVSKVTVNAIVSHPSLLLVIIQVNAKWAQGVLLAQPTSPDPAALRPRHDWTRPVAGAQAL